MNKYVIEYSTGEYDSYMCHVIPLEYNGSIDELKEELNSFGHRLLYRKKMFETMLRFGLYEKLTNSEMYDIKNLSRRLKVGSGYFEFEDFCDDTYSHRNKCELERYKSYLPEIQTLEEWFCHGTREDKYE